MSYNYDKYEVPNKWIEEDFEKLAELYEKAQKQKEKEND